MARSLRSTSSCLILVLIFAMVMAGGCGKGAGGPSGESGPKRAVGTDWEKVALDEAVSGYPGEDVFITDVCAGGPGLVAVGCREKEGSSSATLLVWTSEDGKTWNRVEVTDSSELGTSPGPRVAAGPGGVVIACGQRYWTSGDGLEWTYHPPDHVNFQIYWTDQYSLRPSSISDLCAAGPGYVMVGTGVYGRNFASGGQDGCVWVSTDGQTFSLLSFDPSAFDGFMSINAVSSGGPGFVAGGDFSWTDADGSRVEGQIWISPDGFGWTRLPRDSSVFGGAGRHTIKGICAGGPGLVAVGEGTVVRDNGALTVPVVWTSPDGTSWSRIELGETFLNSSMCGVTAGGPGLVAVGESMPGPGDPGRAGNHHRFPVVWVSPDGNSWTRVSLPDGEELDFRHPDFSITSFSGGLVVAGSERSGSDGRMRAAIWISMP